MQHGPGDDFQVVLRREIQCVLGSYAEVAFMPAGGLYQQHTSDVNTMFKVFRRSCLNTISLSSDGFELDIELVCKLVLAGHAPLEAPS